MRRAALRDSSWLESTTTLRFWSEPEVCVIEVDGRPASEVATELAAFPEVFAAHLVTGRYDIDMLVALHDFDELSDLMLNKFSKVHGIRSMSPAIAVDIVKYKFDVAPIEARTAA